MKYYRNRHQIASAAAISIRGEFGEETQVFKRALAGSVAGFRVRIAQKSGVHYNSFNDQATESKAVLGLGHCYCSVGHRFCERENTTGNIDTGVAGRDKTLVRAQEKEWPEFE